MKTFAMILGAVLVTASTVQIASAGQRDKVRKIDRSQPTQSQQYRDSNAYYAPNNARDWRNDGYGYSNDRVQSLYPGGAISAPAGR